MGEKGPPPYPNLLDLEMVWNGHFCLITKGLGIAKLNILMINYYVKKYIKKIPVLFFSLRGGGWFILPKLKQQQKGFIEGLYFDAKRLIGRLGVLK